jgi:hypothetical protein
MMLAYKASQLAPEAPDGSAGPPAVVLASLNFAQARLNLPLFKRVTSNPPIFIDKKYKNPILEQCVVITPGCLIFPTHLTFGR